MEWKGYALIDSKGIWALFEDKKLVDRFFYLLRRFCGLENHVIRIVVDKFGKFTCPDWR